MTDNPNATAFIEDVLLPEIEVMLIRKPKNGSDTAYNNALLILKQLIQSRRSEWEGK